MKRKLVVGFGIGLLVAISTAFAQNASDFQISGGTLVKYNGNGGNVTVPARITRIGNGAFQSSTQLTSITLPPGVTSIGEAAFGRCPNLTNITLPNSVTSIGSGAFGGSGLRSITLPEGITTIEHNTFIQCRNLSSIVLPASLTSVGTQAFRDCDSLVSIVLPKGVTRIGGYAFSGCTSLSSIVLPKGVTRIEGYAFGQCTSLSSIMLPSGLINIEKNAFALCNNLNSVFLPGSVQIAYEFPPSVTLFDASTILQRVREEYVSNPRSGDANWKGKRIGVVAKIESFEADGSVIIVQTVNATTYRSVCHFNTSFSDSLFRYDSGSEITLVGAVVGMERLSSGVSAVVLSNGIPIE